MIGWIPDVQPYRLEDEHIGVAKRSATIAITYLEHMNEYTVSIFLLSFHFLINFLLGFSHLCISCIYILCAKNTFKSLLRNVQFLCDIEY